MAGEHAGQWARAGGRGSGAQAWVSQGIVMIGAWNGHVCSVGGLGRIGSGRMNRNGSWVDGGVRCAGVPRTEPLGPVDRGCTARTPAGRRPTAPDVTSDEYSRSCHRVRRDGPALVIVPMRYVQRPTSWPGGATWPGVSSRSVGRSPVAIMCRHTCTPTSSPASSGRVGGAPTSDRTERDQLVVISAPARLGVARSIHVHLGVSVQLDFNWISRGT